MRARVSCNRSLGNALHPLGSEQKRTAEAIKLSTNEDAGDFYNIRARVSLPASACLCLPLPACLPTSIYSSLLYSSCSSSSSPFSFSCCASCFSQDPQTFSSTPFRSPQRPSNGVAGPGSQELPQKENLDIIFQDTQKFHSFRCTINFCY